MTGRVQAGGNGDRDLEAVPEIERVVRVGADVANRARDAVAVGIAGILWRLVRNAD